MIGYLANNKLAVLYSFRLVMIHNLLLEQSQPLAPALRKFKIGSQLERHNSPLTTHHAV